MDMETTKLLDDLEKMVPQQAPKWVNWDKARKEQGQLW